MGGRDRGEGSRAVMHRLKVSIGRFTLRRQIGPFCAVFAPTRTDHVPYLSLLNLVDDQRSLAALRLVRRADVRRGAERHRVDLLQASDWRVQLVGAVVMSMSPSDSAVAAGWSAIDHGSWVTPQIAAVLSRVDPNFLLAARERMNDGCRVDSSALGAMDNAIARHVSQGPGDLDARVAKMASSLAALLALDHRSDPIVAQLCQRAEVVSLISQDRDGSGEIATAWRDRLEQLLPVG